MSYDIYKSVKQLKDGSFEVISTSNNDSPYYVTVNPEFIQC